MKFFSIVFALVLSMGSLTAEASMPVSGKNQQELRKEVARMIEAPSIQDFGMEETAVFVHFTVSESNEIEVVHVAAANDYLANHIKQQLNHRQIKSAPNAKNGAYNLRIHIKSEAN